MQTKKGSLIEACVNTFIGFLISVIANPLFCWLFNVKMNAGQMTGYVGAFTVLSVLRSYVIRRFFNTFAHDMAEKLIRLKARFGYNKYRINNVHQHYYKITAVNKVGQNVGGYQPIEDVKNVPPGHDLNKLNRASLKTVCDMRGILYDENWSIEFLRYTILQHINECNIY